MDDVIDHLLRSYDAITVVGASRHPHKPAHYVPADMLRHGWDKGARRAYLQVQLDNEVARRLYASFGFSQRYTYWYRGRPGA